MSHAISFDHYFDYQELTQILQELKRAISTADEGFLHLHQQRGPRGMGGGDHQPCHRRFFWRSPPTTSTAITMPGEVTGSMACMHTIVQLVTQYGVDEAITALLDGTTVYVIPRVSPMGRRPTSRRRKSCARSTVPIRFGPCARPACQGHGRRRRHPHDARQDPVWHVEGIGPTIRG